MVLPLLVIIEVLGETTLTVEIEAEILLVDFLQFCSLDLPNAYLPQDVIACLRLTSVEVIFLMLESDPAFLSRHSSFNTMDFCQQSQRVSFLDSMIKSSW